MLQPEASATANRLVPYLKAGHVQWGGVQAPLEMPMMWASADDIQNLAVQEGDLLICEGGEVGRAALVPAGLPPDTIIQNSLHLVRTGSSASARYLRYAVAHVASSGWIDLICNKATIAHLTVEKLKELPVPTWSKSEQTCIANFLDEQTARIDVLIAAKERLESSLKDIEEVTAFDLVVRGTKADVGRQSFREPWLSDVPAHWELSKLRHIATVGNGSTPKRDNAAYWEGGTLPWLNSGSVNASRISEASDYVTANAKKECHLPVVRPGSTVVALTGQGKTRGSASIVEFETTLNQHLAYISLFDDRRMSDEYLCVVLTGMYSVLRYISDDAGSTKGALTCEQLNHFRVPIPPAEEQVAIVDAYGARTKAINELRAHARLHIDRLREYRSSLISAAVTGQLDINSYKEAA